MRLWAWGQSDPGRKRERNEDSYLVDPETGVMAVADGMGGHQGGATASRMAVELPRPRARRCARQLRAGAPRADPGRRCVRPRRWTWSSAALPSAPMRPHQFARLDVDAIGLEPTLSSGAVPVFSPALELMRGVVRRASSAIFEAAWEKPELRGMGTTLTAVLVHDGRAHVVHAGDSRCYMFRDGSSRQLTDDHSWIAEQLRSGSISEAEAKNSKFRHVITKSIGFERDIEADTQERAGLRRRLLRAVLRRDVELRRARRARADRRDDVVPQSAVDADRARERAAAATTTSRSSSASSRMRHRPRRPRSRGAQRWGITVTSIVRPPALVDRCSSVFPTALPTTTRAAAVA